MKNASSLLSLDDTQIYIHINRNERKYAAANNLLDDSRSVQTSSFLLSDLSHSSLNSVDLVNDPYLFS